MAASEKTPETALELFAQKVTKEVTKRRGLDTFLARVLAELLREDTGVTQRQIVLRTGFLQKRVSRYVNLLLQKNLIIRLGQSPALYQPSKDLKKRDRKSVV